MTTPTRDEKAEMTRAKLKQAFQLAKAGQYNRARHILKPIDYHPQAQKMLAMMDGKQDKRKKAKPAFSPFRVIVTLFVIFMVGGSIFAAVMFQSWVNNVGLLGIYGLGDGFELSAEAQLELDLTSYCFTYTNFASDSCSDWATTVINRHEASAQSCFAPYADEFFLTDEQFGRVRTCLRNAGIPNPS
ncbi:MAG: hypothetical protein AAFV93_17480 [Chloroflexota bacterium]